MSEYPIVKPILTAKRDAPMKQPRHETLPRIPARALLVAPSNSGKTATLIWMLIEGYRGLFDRIYVFCKTANCDSAWGPLVKYCREELKVPADEQILYDEWDAEAVDRICEEAAAMTA